MNYNPLFWIEAVLLLFGSVFVLTVPLIRNKLIQRPYLDMAKNVANTEQKRIVGVKTPHLLRVSSIISKFQAVVFGSRWGYFWPTTIIMSVIVLVGTLSLYIKLGSPNLPDFPFSRISSEINKIEYLISELEKRLETTLVKTDSWILLARSQRQLGYYDAAVHSFRTAIEQGASDFDVLVSYGEMLVINGHGHVSPEAKETFRNAYLLNSHTNIDSNDPRPAFYLGLADLQEGDNKKGIAIWLWLEKQLLLGDPLLAILQQCINNIAEQDNLVVNSISPLPPIEHVTF